MALLACFQNLRDKLGLHQRLTAAYGDASAGPPVKRPVLFDL
jgi:hypothetical protein